MIEYFLEEFFMFSNLINKNVLVHVGHINASHYASTFSGVLKNIDDEYITLITKKEKSIIIKLSAISVIEER